MAPRSLPAPAGASAVLARGAALVLVCAAAFLVVVLQFEVQELQNRLDFTVQSFNERFEDFELRLAGRAPIWDVDASGFDQELVSFFVAKYPPNHYVPEMSDQQDDRYCSWQELSKNFSGRWVSEDSARSSGVHFAAAENRLSYEQSCPFISTRYYCIAGKKNKPLDLSNFVWVPELKEACRMHSHVSLFKVMRTNEEYAILFHGDSLLKEFVQSLLCQFMDQVDEKQGSANNIRVSFTSGLTIHYVFRDYDMQEIREMYKGKDLNEEFDMYVTNYGAINLKKNIESLGFYGQVVLIETSIKGATEPEVGQINKSNSALGVPFLSLSEMVRQAMVQRAFDPKVATHGIVKKAGDPHLCLPGIHDDAVRVFLHMLQSLMEQQEEEESRGQSQLSQYIGP
jgi:hypothetical protein